MKKKEGVQIIFNFSNRILYTFISIVILLIVGVGVYASTFASSSGVGHDASEIEEADPRLPSCSNGQVIKWGGSGWACGADIDTDTIKWLGEPGNVIYLNNGRVGIGTSNPSNFIGWPASLQVNGEIRAARYYDDDASYYIDINSNSYFNVVHAYAFNYRSDISLKNNIQPLSNSLDKIRQIEGVSFNWKESGEETIGLIAQNIEKVFPELVSTDDEGLKSVQYGNLVAPLIEAIKEQQNQIEKLQKEIEELKNK